MVVLNQNTVGILIRENDYFIVSNIIIRSVGLELQYRVLKEKRLM